MKEGRGVVVAPVRNSAQRATDSSIIVFFYYRIGRGGNFWLHYAIWQKQKGLTST